MCIFARCVWQNFGRESQFICGLVQGYANCMRYLVAPACLDGCGLRTLSLQFTASTVTPVPERAARVRKGEASIVSPNRLHRQFNPDSKKNKPVAPRYRFIIPTRPLHITAIKKQAVLLQFSYRNIYASTLTRVNSLQRRCLLNDAFLIVRYHQFFMSLKYFPGIHVYA